MYIYKQLNIFTNKYVRGDIGVGVLVGVFSFTILFSFYEERLVNVEKKKTVFDAKSICNIMVEHAIVDKKSQKVLIM
ncbi:hypothetical protein PFNF54_02169 [Plasmodium falciparum NF54]|uniref:Uncharacterized protein n=1 Tax=Plasmodium falciparum (isolate NF54) TaxID=5843 RepID=W7JV77_PLAFO|nr:hypothetical protein PFNF54_02169 [Plasmodium falciparum NF54]